MAGEANIWNPRTLVEISADTKSVEQKLTATAGQTLFTITDFIYVVGTGALEVHKNGLLLTKGTDWVEQTDITFSLIAPATVGDIVVASGHVGITGDVDPRDTDIFISNYQAIRDYAGVEVTVYAQGKVTSGDGGEHFFQKFTGAAPGFYVDDNYTAIVPTGGDGSVGWIRKADSVINFDTIALATASQGITVGDTLHLSGRVTKFDSGEGMWDVVLTSAVTPNTTSIVVCTGLPTLSLVLRKSAINTVTTYGADGTAAGDYAAIVAADIAGECIFTSGTYTMNTAYVFVSKPLFHKGAVLTVGTNLVEFNQGISAGDHVIFNSALDLTSTLALLKTNTNIKIKVTAVNANWFCEFVDDVEDIKTIVDQTNHMNQAYRAAVGDYSTASGANWNTEYPTGRLELGIGYYRIDKRFALGTIDTGVFYKVTGFSLRGKGVASSFLVRTDLANTDYVFMCSFYTGELTVAKGFKIVAYDPDAGSPYNSAAKCLMYCQGDSLQLEEIWVAGAQTPVVDTQGVKRSGVGIQFASCVDTYFHDIFTEFCVTGVAFHSSIVSGNNLELYQTQGQGIGIGNFDPDYGDAQTTQSVVSISGIQSRAAQGNAITVIEGSNEGGDIQLSNAYFDGYDSEFAITVGNIFCFVADGKSIAGNFSNVIANSFRDSTFISEGTTSFLGTAINPLKLNNFKADKQTFGAASGFINTKNSTYCNIVGTNIALDTWAGVIIHNLSAATGKISLNEVYLSNYVGQSDGGAGRNLLVSAAAVGIDIKGLHRATSDTIALTAAYATAGAVYLDFGAVTNLTRTASGGATFTMPSRVTFV